MSDGSASTPERRVGDYRLVRLLGSGGMGSVHEAVGPDGTHVALKLLHPAVSADPDARRRLRREVSLLHLVRDTGVARVLDAEVDADEVFVVTELVEGPTLEQEVREGGPFTPDELSGLAHGLAESLRAIHDVGVVHRDFKPSNVMMSDSGPVVIDFGIAQAVEDARLTRTGLVTGTAGYLDPQMVGGADPGPGGDWWSWAAVLLFAATGRAPFGTGPEPAVMARAASGGADVTGLEPLTARALRAALRTDPATRLSPDGLLAVLDGRWDAGRLDREVGRDDERSVPPRDDAGTRVLPAAVPPPVPPATDPRRTDAGRAGPAGGTRVLPVRQDPRQLPDRSSAVDPHGGPGTVDPYAHTAEGPVAHPGTGPVPLWARDPRHRRLVVAVAGLGLSVLAAYLPGVFALVAVAVLVLAATTGYAGRSRRESRRRNGLRRGDDARMLAALPWHLVRGVLAVAPGVVAGAVLGLGAWLGAPFLGDARITEALALWAGGLLGLTAAWLTPTSAPARQGARAWVAVLTPTRGFRTLLVGVVLVVVVVAALQVLAAPPSPTWGPLAEPGWSTW